MSEMVGGTAFLFKKKKNGIHITIEPCLKQEIYENV